MSREIIHFQSEALGPITAVRSGEAVAFVRDAIRKNLHSPLICRFADGPAMDRFFSQELLPALETPSKAQPAPHVVFLEFPPSRPVTESLVDALRALFPEIRGFGIMEWMPLEVAIALIAKGPAERGRILVIAGMNHAKHGADSEWRQVRAGLGTLARLAGVRVILGADGRDEPAASKQRRQKAPRRARPIRPEPEGELFRGRKRPGMHLRGAQGLATAAVSGMLFGTAVIAVLWLSVSSAQPGNARTVRLDRSRPVGETIASVGDGSEAGMIAGRGPNRF